MPWVGTELWIASVAADGGRWPGSFARQAATQSSQCFGIETVDAMPKSSRRTLIGGASQMIIYDDLEPSEKVKVYDKGVTLADAQGALESMIGYRTGDMWAPQLGLTEGLRVEAQHFLECVTHGRQPLTDGHCGLRVIGILEAAARSLAQRGQPAELLADSEADGSAGVQIRGLSASA